MRPKPPPCGRQVTSTASIMDCRPDRLLVRVVPLHAMLLASRNKSCMPKPKIAQLDPSPPGVRGSRRVTCFSRQTRLASHSPILSKIKWALGLFYGPAWYAMSIDHRGLHVAMAKEFLDCPNVVIRLQKVSGKTVPKGVGGDAFGELGPAHSLVKRILDMRLVQMISPQFLCRRNLRECLLRKKPLPDKIPGCRGIFLFKPVIEKDSCISRRKILSWFFFTTSSWEVSSGTIVSGRGTVRSFFPFPCTVSIRASKLKSLTRSCRHSNNLSPHP